MKLPPRGLTKAEASAYVGCKTLSSFSDRVRRGILPGPIPGTHTWDRVAIDRVLNAAAGIVETVTPASALAEWKATRAKRGQ